MADETGKIYGRGYSAYGLQTPRAGWAEQNADGWWQAVVAAVRQATADVEDRAAVGALSLSTQGASMLAADGAGNPLCPVITWLDGRAAREAAELTAAVGEAAVYRKSGWPPSPWCDAAKIAWLRRYRPALFQKAGSFISTLEFINIKLTGQNVIDPTNGAIRQLMDMEKGRWDSEILSFLEISEDRLPKILPAGAYLGKLQKAAAEALGLSPKVRVYNGAHDQYCAAIGSGTVAENAILLATGTAWAVFGVTGRPVYTPSRLAPGVFPLSGKFGLMTTIPGAGLNLKWWKDITQKEYDALCAGAASRMESARELLFCPRLADGEGFLKGLSVRHDEYDIARAIMEGVTFEVRRILEEFAQNGLCAETITMTGGGAKSPVWCAIVGYVTGRRILLAREADAACLGAAMLALMGEGQFASLADCAKAVAGRSAIELPDCGAYAFYEEKYRRYQGVAYVRG